LGLGLVVVRRRLLLGLHGGSRSQVILIVVNCLDVEASGVVRLEGRETAGCLDLEGASLTLGQSDVHRLLLASRVKAKCCVITTSILSEGAEGFGEHGVGVFTGAVEGRIGKSWAAVLILAADCLFGSPCSGV